MTLVDEMTRSSYEKDTAKTDPMELVSKSQEFSEQPNDPRKTETNEPKITSRYVGLMLCCLCYSFLMGYQMLTVSGYLLLKKDFPGEIRWKERLVGVTSGAAMLGSIVCGQLSDKIGRKKTILLSGALHIIGSILQTTGVYYTLPGRIFVSLAFGLSSVAVPVYLAESSPSKQRGYAMVLNQSALIFGLFFSVLLAAALSYIKHESWRYLMGFALIPSVIQFVGFIWLPESPRYLLQKGKLDEVEKEMSSLLVTSNTEEIKIRQDLSGGLEKTSMFHVWKRIVKTPCVWRALLICCSLHIIAQLSGINVVMFYSGIFLKSQIKDDSIALWLSSIPIFANFLFSFVGLYLIERIGRRKLLFFSTLGVIITLFFMGMVYLRIENQSYPVTVFEDVANTSHCIKHRSCLDCVSDQQCGFCYVNEPSLEVINGSCLPVNQEMPSVATGRCNISSSGNQNSILTWSHSICPSNLIFWILVGQVLYIACFASGLGSLPWTICAEVYPMWARSQCNGIVVGVMWLCSWLLTGNFLTLSQQITSYGSYFLMSCITLVGLTFWYVYLPETKGKKLEETEALFSKPFCFCCKGDKEKQPL
ncbi:proton myo-inositol cotransporter [Octopus bimaculoides]|uniref:Major facilitator superfamily (MFS) profile domain-containing protein n=2 Tax=Octopus bimaculoides TaxID=37653 RepID=A0A0L8GT51_OCTBM|nr:proton myo-inositol cotransporter [Octopus bimaculoides]XP_052822117.1 proton myo-inositol cotransporter [Octopus bimaculoides]|eukprot:XP_014778195.1 PREDICTED: proton myo-inositol cotransporter-like [Octopus bimaculoides]